MRSLRYLKAAGLCCLSLSCRDLGKKALASDEIPFHGYLPVVQQGKLGFIDGSGKIAIPPQFDLPVSLSLDEAHFAEGLEPIQMAGKWGYIGTDGKFAINPQFDWAGQFSEGRGAVYQNGKWGFVDRSGVLVVTPQFDAVRLFKDGRALVQVGGKWGFIGPDGKYLINPQFDTAGMFAEHFADVQIDGKWGLIDENGKFAINPQFDYLGEFLDGLAPVQVGDKYGYVDAGGKLVVNPQFPSASMFRGARARAEVGHSFGFIDHDGKFAINPQFDAADDFHNGLAAVSTGGRWGYVGPDGKYIINPQFDAAGAFWDGLAAVRQAGKVGFIDRDGHFVVNPDFDAVALQPVGHFRWVQKDDKIGYVDQSGHFVWPLTSVAAVDTAGEGSEAAAPTPQLSHSALQSAFLAVAQLQEAARARLVQRRFLGALPEAQRSRYSGIPVVGLNQETRGFLSAGSSAQMGILLPAGQAVSVSVRSGDFDTVLQVFAIGADGDQVLGVNDDFDGSNSRVNLCAGAGGPRLLSVTAYVAGRSGNFVAQVSRLGANPGNCVSSAPPQPIPTTDTLTTTTVDTTRKML
jgi:hypothetical protein